MDKKTLLEILNSDSMEFTLAEIQEIVDEELAKDPEEMDTELIDLCANVIGEACAGNSDEEAPKKKRNIKINKAFLLVAIITLFTAVAVPVSAKFTNNEVSDKIVNYRSGAYTVNLCNGETKAKRYSNNNTDLLKALNTEGIDDVILPAALLEQNYESTVRVAEENGFKKANIMFTDNDSKTNGIIVISDYNDHYEFAIGQGNIPSETEQIEQFTANGLDILVFEKNEDIYIMYADKETNYNISLFNCTFEKAVEIANTLK